MGFAPVPSDPFYELMRPPLDETPAQATARQQREREAQARSDEIDKSIKQAREIAKKEKNIVKVLLLGQSESGEVFQSAANPPHSKVSSLLYGKFEGLLLGHAIYADFRMRYARDDWEKERDGWRAVVQLNIVRSIITILGVVEPGLNGAPPADLDDSPAESDAEVETPEFGEEHRLLSIRLAPLRKVEAELKQRLGAVLDPVQTGSPMVSTPFEAVPDDSNSRRAMTELTVRSWKDVVDPNGRPLSTEETSAALDSLSDVIAGCKDDMQALWNDKNVRIALKRRKLGLPDSAGFFLNDVERIASRDYVVSDNDIVRARLRTVGIQEHRLKFKHGPFDDPKMSPVSVFDQRLEEDPRVNRLEDSIILWTSICQSKLLAKTQLILFLNKCDLLRRKLKRGVRVKDFLPSYGSRPNEVIPVVKYLREKFKDIQKRSSPELRSAYVYPTTVTV
ncbi:hypothetical protein C0989_008682 [Termitomyces sp. Mn162]|nr:hypothetical protein C0989_008682 [Termitomyces sp. Mn162]